MNNLNSVILTIFLTLLFACSQTDPKHDNSVDNVTSDTTNNVHSVNSLTSDTSSNNQLSELTNPHEDKIEGYTFKYGYSRYDEEKYGFNNPGFLNIYKDDKLVYSDSFKGEGPVGIESLGHYDLDGDKLVFRLNYGTEACDYAYTSKYYFLDKDKFNFLKECYSITGGDQYSSRFYEHIFPEDSLGKPNTILIVEGQIFHEKDQPDRFDTTFIKFEDKKFKITKLTDNLSKVK